MSTHNLCFGPEIRKNNVYLCKPYFYYIKVGFKRVKIRYVFVMENEQEKTRKTSSSELLQDPTKNQEY